MLDWRECRGSRCITLDSESQGVHNVPCMSTRRLKSIRWMDAQYLRRLSLDIRGRVPTIEEWANFDATNPQVTIDAFLEDEGFGMRIRSMYAPIYRTVTNTYNLTGADFQWDDEIAFAVRLGKSLFDCPMWRRMICLGPQL